jgi:hypothetical protein
LVKKRLTAEAVGAIIYIHWHTKGKRNGIL